MVAVLMVSVLTAAIFLGYLAMAVPAFAASCNKADGIRQAFADNIAHQAKRAERISGDAAAAQIRDGFNDIGTRDVSCDELYDSYNEYLQQVKDRNDDAAGGGIFQFKFRKW